MKRLSKLEGILWSVALPGFPQLLTGQFLKGALLVILEFVINVNSNFNQAIMYSFLWEIDKAFKVVDYQWLMFYPCVYMFSMWDAYRHALDEKVKRSYLPFVFGAYMVTVGLMLSPKLKIFGISLGPVFWPMLFLLPGLLIGFVIRIIMNHISKEK
ncbi:hypothetical protein M3182_10815 [Mesobacillus maritimus]|uniref:hypothetical protein n=1 Tax=Mesobacillus maritimus TaxID=1643336 RepID=UPI00203ECDDB|nr:hypothetical protein [Mesobacillus maritimus]MCM3586221.1 hypothetical protein [Mesobacillus maritimus]MCM3667548.1 hypothetical protein [Mesobacillus maritimus]